MSMEGQGEALPKRWEYWLYPALRRFESRQVGEALSKAKQTSFDAIEIVGIVVALVLVVGLTRYSVANLGLIERLGAAIANFLVAIPLLVVFAGPFYVRRVRRGLEQQLSDHRN